MNSKALNLNLDTINMLTLNKHDAENDDPPAELFLHNYRWTDLGEGIHSVDTCMHKYVLVEENSKQ